MRRWATHIFAFLVLGAIVNVAVAWRCASSKSCRGDADVLELEMMLAAVPTSRWHPPTQEPDGTTVVKHEASRARGPFVQEVRKCGYTLAADSREDSIMLQMGWPALALVGDWRGEWIRPSSRLMPISAIWPGFAINTVFYAAMLWGLFAAPFALRRRRRIKRGLCPKCAYDLRGQPAGAANCPECGSVR